MRPLVERTELLQMILRPEALEDVLALLESLELEPASISNVEGVGRQRGHREIFRGREYKIETRPKIRIEVLVSDIEKRENLLRRLRDVVHTGHVGDGKVFVFEAQIPEAEPQKT